MCGAIKGRTIKGPVTKNYIRHLDRTRCTQRRIEAANDYGFSRSFVDKSGRQQSSSPDPPRSVQTDDEPILASEDR